MKSISKWFTLAELLVSVMVLSIISAIWFVSYSQHLTSTRDSWRISAMNNFERIFEVYKVGKWKFPMPTDAIDITYSGATVIQQGFVWDTVYEKLEQSKNPPVDPSSKHEFDYSVSANRQEYNLAYVLETKEYSWKKIPVSKIAWNYNGYFLQSKNNLFAIPSLISADLSETDLLNLHNQWKILSNNSVVYPPYQNTDNSPTKWETTTQLLLETDISEIGSSFVTRLSLLSELQQTYSSMKDDYYKQLNSYEISSIIYDESQLKFIWNQIFKATKEPRLPEYPKNSRYFLFLDGNDDKITIPDFQLESDFEVSMQVSPRKANYTLFGDNTTTGGVLSITGNVVKYWATDYPLTKVPTLGQLNTVTLKADSGKLTILVNNQISYQWTTSLTPQIVSMIWSAYFWWTRFAGIIADVNMSSWWKKRFYKIDDNQEYIVNSQIDWYSDNLVTTNNVTSWDGTEANFSKKSLWANSISWKTYRVDMAIKNYVSWKIRTYFWLNTSGVWPLYSTSDDNLVYFHTPSTWRLFEIQTNSGADRFIWVVEVFIREAIGIWKLRYAWDSSWLQFTKISDGLWYSDNRWGLWDVSEDGSTTVWQKIAWEWGHPNDSYLEPFSDYIYRFTSSNFKGSNVQFQIGLPRLDIDKNKTYKWVINSGDNDMWRMMFNVTQAWTNIDIKDIEIIHALREAK